MRTSCGVMRTQGALVHQVVYTIVWHFKQKIAPLTDSLQGLSSLSNFWSSLLSASSSSCVSCKLIRQAFQHVKGYGTEQTHVQRYCLTCMLVFLLANMLSRFFPSSSISLPSSLLLSSSVDKTSVDVKTLENQKKVHKTSLDLNEGIPWLNKGRRVFSPRWLAVRLIDTLRIDVNATKKGSYKRSSLSLTCFVNQIFSDILLCSVLDAQQLWILILEQTCSYLSG